jgi:hypothetical protein
MKKTFTTASSKLCSAQVLRLCACVFLMASLLSAWQTAHAAAPSDASPAAAATAAATYTAKKTISLDGLMKEVYPNSPLHASILSKALMEANPKLINGKTTQNIQRGATLNIPNHSQLVVQTLAPFAPPPPIVNASPSTEVNQYGSQSSDPSSRRLWIRFP